MVGRSKPQHVRPSTLAEGQAHVRAKVLELFDRRDGTGADWQLMLESLFKAGFELIEAMPESNRAMREKLLLRIHEGAYNRLTARDGESEEEAAGEGVVPTSGAHIKPSAPRPSK